MENLSMYLVMLIVTINTSMLSLNKLSKKMQMRNKHSRSIKMVLVIYNLFKVLNKIFHNPKNNQE
jgi:hypothetical protein